MSRHQSLLISADTAKRLFDLFDDVETYRNVILYSLIFHTAVCSFLASFHEALSQLQACRDEDDAAA